MLVSNPSSLELPAWPDLSPLWWVLGGLGGGFLLLLLLLLPVAVFNTGPAGDNARQLFGLILGTFHAAIKVFAHRRGCSERHPPEDGDDLPPDAGSTEKPDPGGRT